MAKTTNKKVQETAVQETAVQETAVQETAVQETAVQETAVQETAVQETAVQETAVQESLYDVAIRHTSPITSKLENAVNVHVGGSAIEKKYDDNGQEYITATFTLANPTEKRSSIVVNDVTLATELDAMRKDIALGEVSIFDLCKRISNFADTDATSLGFDSTVELVNALFGFGKSTTANYRRIGKYFVNDDLVLVDGIPQESSVSLLNQLLSYIDKETGDLGNVKAIFRYGIVTPYMRQKDYKEVLSILGKMETEKELKNMTPQEIEELKKAIKEERTKSTGKKEKKGKKEEETGQETGQETGVQESNEPRTPQTILGQNLNMLHEIETSLDEIGLTDEEKATVSKALDELYILFNAKAVND